MAQQIRPPKKPNTGLNVVTLGTNTIKKTVTAQAPYEIPVI